MLRRSGESQRLRDMFLTNYPNLPFFRYDSVIYTGELRWQDRLNSYNLPFFLPSTGFFTNYTVSAGTHKRIRLYSTVSTLVAANIPIAHCSLFPEHRSVIDIHATGLRCNENRTRRL